MKEKLIVLALFVTVAFLITAPWFDKKCTFATQGDIEGHFMTSLSFQEQLIKYGRIYPVSFKYFPLGFYHFSYSPFPFLLPLPLRLFLNPRDAFFAVYTIFFALNGFTLYLLLRRKGSASASFFFASLYFLSPLLNQQLSVYGSYHHIIMMPFMFMALLFSQKFIEKPSRKNALFFILFSFLAIITHFIMLVFLFIFFIVTDITKHKLKLTGLFIISALMSSFYYVPVFFQGLVINLSSHAETGIGKLLMVFSHSILFPVNNGEGMGLSDYFVGPYLFISMIISIIVKWPVLKKNNISLIFLAVSLILVILWSFVPFLNSSAPVDRIQFFLCLAFLLVTSFALSKKIFGAELLIVTGILALIFPVQPLLLLLLMNAIFYVVEYFIKRTFHLKIGISLIIIIVLLLSFTNLFLNTINYFRIWCISFPTTDFLHEGDIFLTPLMSSFRSLGYYTNAGYGGTIGHTTLLKKLPSINDKSFISFAKLGGINRILILTNDKGVPFYYRIFKSYVMVYSLTPASLNYSQTIVNPALIHIKTNMTDNVTLRIYYHPWWRAFASDGRELNVSFNGFFINVQNNGYKDFNLMFDMKYFNVGAVISTLSFVFLFFIKKLL